MPTEAHAETGEHRVGSLQVETQATSPSGQQEYEVGAVLRIVRFQHARPSTHTASQTSEQHLLHAHKGQHRLSEFSSLCERTCSDGHGKPHRFDLSSVLVVPSRRRWGMARRSRKSWMTSSARVIWLNSSTRCPAHTSPSVHKGCHSHTR
jgi:hypothetical protein